MSWARDLSIPANFAGELGEILILDPETVIKGSCSMESVSRGGTIIFTGLGRVQKPKLWLQVVLAEMFSCAVK